MFKNITVRFHRFLNKIYLKLNLFFSDHTDKVLCVQFNWDYIVSGSTDKTIKVEIFI